MVGKKSSCEHFFTKSRCHFFFLPVLTFLLPTKGRRGEKWLQSGKRRGASRSKQGLLKTLEALIALFLTFTMLIVFIPRDTVTQQSTEPKGFLPILRENDAFRSCVVSKNVTCINQTINDNLEDNFNFVFNLSDSASANVGGLPDKQIFSESVFITGNVTNSTNTILRIFYWNR